MVTFLDFLSWGSRKSREGGDSGIPPLRKGPRKDGAPGRDWSMPGKTRSVSIGSSYRGARKSWCFITFYFYVLSLEYPQATSSSI